MNSFIKRAIYGNKYTPAKVINVNLDELRTVISFSLYGNVDKYLGGLIKNCMQINVIYPDFWIYVYLGNDFDKSILNDKFVEIRNILLIDSGKGGHEVMSYRFFAIDRFEVGIAFSRDADSRINERDQWCINEFLKSSKKFQIIRDSPSHGVEIPGGMWGIKKGLVIHIQNSLEKFKTKTGIFKHGTDQDFLAEYVYPRVRDHAIVFDGFFQYRSEFRVTIPLPYDEHVGAPIYVFSKSNIQNNMISGKVFSEKCKWVIDPRYPSRKIFNYVESNDGDWVFVNGDFLNRLLEQLPVSSSKKFTFIIHNSDASFDTQKLERLKPYASRIYAINTNAYDNILTTIPIGFVDRQLPFLSTFNPTNVERPYEIYMNFTMSTNMNKRNECVSIFKDDQRVVKKQNRSVSEYYDDLCKSKYVLCPEGTGIDTHRIYESILCGAIPVVVRNSLSHMYEKLPVCILDKWTDQFYEPTQKEYSFTVDYFL